MMNFQIRKWLSLPLVVSLTATFGTTALLTMAAWAQGDLPAIDDLESGWNQIETGGATICARGTPYSFFVRPGDSDRLVVYFQGGGACWNDFSCQVGGPFDASVTPEEVANYDGIFNFENEANPVADWTFVFVPYCTADVHTGEAVVDYTSVDNSFSIAFNGAVNAQAVLDWTYANIESPSELLITGSSAGAYGAIYHAPHILDAYPDTQSTVLGDAGVGVVAPGWNGLETWNMEENLYQAEDFTPQLNEDFNGALYAYVSVANPDVRVAQYTTFADSVQIGFYSFQGGSPEDWAVGMQTQLAALETAENFRSYVAPGNSHTILASPIFYTMITQDVAFVDWFTDLLTTGDAENIACVDCE